MFLLEYHVFLEYHLLTGISSFWWYIKFLMVFHVFLTAMIFRSSINDAIIHGISSLLLQKAEWQCQHLTVKQAWKQRNTLIFFGKRQVFQDFRAETRFEVTGDDWHDRLVFSRLAFFTHSLTLDSTQFSMLLY
jgi:hypothetical protein